MAGKVSGDSPVEPGRPRITGTGGLFIPNKLVAFLHKRWVRFVGVVPASLYTFCAVVAAIDLLKNTVFRPPNQVFPGTDLVGWMGYLFFLTITCFSGIMAVATAYYMRGFFRILYLSGFLGITGPLLYFPLSFSFNAGVEFYPQVPNEQFVVGEWKSDQNRLELRADSTFEAEFNYTWLFGSRRDTHSGRWALDRHELHLIDQGAGWSDTWEVTFSDGHFFLTYSLKGNPDAWGGNLGLMRSDEWDATH